MISAEWKVLVRATALDPDGDPPQGLRRLMSYDVDMDKVIRMAVYEGLASLLYKNFQKWGLLQSLSLSQKERLQSIYYRTIRKNTELLSDLKQVLGRLNGEGGQVVLLQGMALVQGIYPDIGLRPMTDIDLWVRERDYRTLTGILLSEGYQRDPVYPDTFRRGSTSFDLHKQILWTDRIGARRFLLKRGEEPIYQSARRFDVEGEMALCLSPQDQVLYLSLHALKHHMNRLIWLVDIGRTVAHWDHSEWERLMKRAGELGLERVLCYVLFLLVRVLGSAIHPEARQFLEGRRLHLLERWVLRKRIKGHPLPFWAPVLLFSSEKGLRSRLALIHESIFPRREVLGQIFPDRSQLRLWQLYLLRVLQLLKRMGGPEGGF